MRNLLEHCLYLSPFARECAFLYLLFYNSQTWHWLGFHFLVGLIVLIGQKNSKFPMNISYDWSCWKKAFITYRSEKKNFRFFKGNHASTSSVYVLHCKNFQGLWSNMELEMIVPGLFELFSLGFLYRIFDGFTNSSRWTGLGCHRIVVSIQFFGTVRWQCAKFQQVFCTILHRTTQGVGVTSIKYYDWW